MLTKLFTALAVTAGVTSAAANAPVGKFNGYWGQNGKTDGTDRLRDRCDEGPDYVSLSFVNVSPENGNGTGYPGTNFAAHCGAEWYYKDGRKSGLLKGCDPITEDIPYCQSKGVKVLLSIGGVWSDDPRWYSDYTVSSRENGVEFAKFLTNAFGTPKANYDGPRPFGDAVLDGFDFDIEKKLDNGPWIAMIQALRTLNPSVFISGAPQCPLSEQYFDMREMIQQAHFDALFIQFYNNPGCDLIAGNAAYEEFNYEEWEKTIAASENSKDAKLYIGLPADPKDAAHVRHGPLKHIVCKYAKRSSFGGISLWDLYLGFENKVDGKTYNEWIREILDNGCDEETTTTTTAMPTTTKATTAMPTTTKATTSPITTKPWGNSTTSGVEMTTSVVYTTRTYTVTSCAPTVTDCPAGHVTTEVVPVYTTVCPVSEVQTHPGHQEPTGTVIVVPTDTVIVVPTDTVIVVPTDTGMQTSVRPTMSKPADNNNCPGAPHCPAVSQPAGNDNNGNNGNNGNNCPGPNCPTVTKPADNNNNCPGPNCPPGVAVPTGGNHGNNTIPGKPLPPVTGSASSMAVGLTGLIAAVAAQALLL